MNKDLLKKIIVVSGLVFFLVAFFAFDLDSYFTLEFFKENQQKFSELFKADPLFVSLTFGLVYIGLVSLSFPGATVLTLAAGAIFGLGYGTLVVSLASTIGATLAFLGTRYVFKDFIEKKFKSRMVQINEGLEKEGSFYLFTLRLLPIVPFFLVNTLMGLTSFKVVRFFYISQVGMLPGTLVYVNAGTQLSKLESLKGILSWDIFLSFALLGLFPLITKRTLEYFKSKSQLNKYKKPKSYDYNMVVIGAGSAGLVSAYIGAAVKAKVALIEKHKMGGDCLNTGCVPSKALIRSAKIVSYIRRAQEYGLEKCDPKFEFAKVMERVQKIIGTIEPHDSIERYSALGVECISGEAKIVSPYEVKVNDRILRTRNIVIATGARPMIPKIPGLEKINFLTSDTIWNLRQLPQRLVVLGGGPIGCEIAQAFARFGSKVILVEMSDRIMSREDVDVSQYVVDSFTKDGVEILVSHKALQIKSAGAVKTLVCEHNGKTIEIAFDEILLALGRNANITGFGIEDLQIATSKKGTIVADEYLRTNYPNIFVCGDVTGPFQFTHTASHQAWFVAVNALFAPFKKFKVDYRVIPWCTFSDPEVARVGINELDAKAAGIDYQVSKYDIEDLDRAIADSEAIGFVKVLTSPGSDKILGVTIVGHRAGEIIGEYVTAMKFGLGLNKILSTIHIYPTLSEANKYAAGVWKKQTAPQGILKILSKFHAWRLG